MSRMTLSDRIAIEAGIYARKNLTEIAKSIYKSRRHVSEEIRRNGTQVSGEHPYRKICHNATGCKRKGLCGKADCTRRCCTCQEIDCQSICSAFRSGTCKQLEKPPYVCNVCTNRRRCKMDRLYYIAQQADAVARRRYAQARSKPHIQDSCKEPKSRVCTKRDTSLQSKYTSRVKALIKTYVEIERKYPK